MKIINLLNDSFERMMRMAETAGRDITSGSGTTRLSAQRLRQSVFRCYRCAFAEECQVLLASSNRLDTVPSYCPNRQMINGLPEIPGQSGRGATPRFGAA